MPIYEYKCRSCGRQFEYLILSSTPAPKCPSCKKKDLERLISLSAVSSESSRQASLSAAHKRAAIARKEKQHEDHQHLHEHFEDHLPPKPKKKK
jgi:putative FmdB family regulatory protein